MRGRLRTYLSYSNVMATIAVFVALGGTSYAVATGSINSREIDNNTIRSRDVRNNDLRGRDIRNNTLRGPDVLESSLNIVPRADVANSANTAMLSNTANSATVANLANSANSLGSQSKIAFQAGESTPAQTIYSTDNLTISASCGAGGTFDITATTAVDNATIHANGTDTTENIGDIDFDTGEVAGLSDDNEERDLVYTEPGGEVVVVQWAATAGNLYGGPAGCLVKGVAQEL